MTELQTARLTTAQRRKVRADRNYPERRSGRSTGRATLERKLNRPSGTNLPERRADRQSGNRDLRRSGRRSAGRPARAHLVSERKRRPSAAQDYSLYLIIIFLVAFGLIMLLSTSSYASALDHHGDSFYYFRHQAGTTAAGLVLMVIVANIDYHRWKKIAGLAYAGSAVLVALVSVVGVTRNGAKRWIYLGPISIQPAEISKITVILLTAVILERMRSADLGTLKGMFKAIAPAALQAALIYKITNNLSSAIIVASIGMGMIFIASRKYWPYFLLAGGVVLLAAAAVYMALHGIGPAGFRKGRLKAWVDPAAYADGVGFQTLQALYGIGSGGIFGKGLGQSMQKLGYIPEAQNDMIFSIICEELGLFGAVSIIIMFVILCWRIMIIAGNASDMFGGMIASGVMIQIAVQVILNIAVVTNTIPNTGISLPFISYGGTSVLLLLAEMGLVLSVSRSIRRKAAGET